MLKEHDAINIEKCHVDFLGKLNDNDMNVKIKLCYRITNFRK